MAKKLGHRQKKTFVCSVCGNVIQMILNQV